MTSLASALTFIPPADTARPEPVRRPPPILIGDCATPLGQRTLLLRLLSEPPDPDDA